MEAIYVVSIGLIIVGLILIGIFKYQETHTKKLK